MTDLIMAVIPLAFVFLAGFMAGSEHVRTTVVKTVCALSEQGKSPERLWGQRDTVKAVMLAMGEEGTSGER